MTGAEKGQAIERIRVALGDPGLSTRLDAPSHDRPGILRWCVTSKRRGWRPVAGHHDDEGEALAAVCLHPDNYFDDGGLRCSHCGVPWSEAEA